MRALGRTLAILAFSSTVALSAPEKPKIGGVRDYEEEDVLYGITDKDAKEKAAERLKKVREMKSRLNLEMKVEGGILKGYSMAAKKTRPPGFISAREVPSMARLVGPTDNMSGLRLHSKVFLRWNSPSPPKVGDEYDTFYPALVMQSIADSTQFDIGAVTDLNHMPSSMRPAGFLYEVSGRVRITEIDKGLVGADVIQVRSNLNIGDRVMPSMPTYASVEPVYSPSELNAVVVAGLPVDRLSTTVGSFIFLNRGRRDGVQLGQVFESVENLRTNDGTISNKTLTHGIVKVIYVSDAYSTGVITEQFDVIRMGSVLRGAQNPTGEFTDPTELPTAASDPVVPPEPAQPLALDPEMSELDKVEKQFQAKNLSTEERERLRKLEQQKLRNKSSNPVSIIPDENNAKEDGADVTNPFENQPPTQAESKKKDSKKKDAKKTKDRRDEEQLNELIQMN